jgi:hypothetical protein
MLNKPVAWKAHPGAQERFLMCPVWECLLHGNRGGGKTDVLLMDYAQGVGVGYGSDYRGLLLREATTELGDVIAKSKKWFPRMFPGAKFNGQKKEWTFPLGETLWMNYAQVESDYDQYHGHEYPWIGWEELTNHPLPNVYLKLMSCNRSSNLNIPKSYRATCNPNGVGHAWVKQRFIDSVEEGKVIREKVEVEIPDKDGEFHKEILSITRTHLFLDLDENITLLKADPLYKAKLKLMTQDNELLEKAWVRGDWDLVIGAYFTDVFDAKIHVINDFALPRSWSIVRSFDWGSSKPWAVTYAAESNGEQPDPGYNMPYIPVGSLFIIAEIYGWNGKPNEGDMATSHEIAERIIYMDKLLEREFGIKVQIGPADTSIYDIKDGKSIGVSLSSFGCHWIRAYKGAGSRITGWSLIRQMLSAAKRGLLEAPHMYFFRRAQHHLRTIPYLQRDKKKPDDIDSEQEDHCADSLRYLTARKMLSISFGKIGM